jgi:outer membrane protein assembly factor BamB
MNASVFRNTTAAVASCVLCLAQTSGAQEAAQAPPVDPLNSNYRIRLAGCLEGEQPLTLVLRMDRGRIVQSWAHPFRSNHPYVQIDVSMLKLEGDRLSGPVTAVLDWNLYELAMDSRIAGNKLSGTYKGRFGDVDVRDVDLAVSGEIIPAAGDAKDVRVELQLMRALQDGPEEARGAAVRLLCREGKWSDGRVLPLGAHQTPPWTAEVVETSLALSPKELTGALVVRVNAQSAVREGEYRFEFHGVREGSAIAGMVAGRHADGTNETGFIGYVAPAAPADNSPRVARIVLEDAITSSGARRDSPKYPIWIFVPMQNVKTDNVPAVSPVSMRVQSAFVGLKMSGDRLAGEAGVVFEYDGQFPEGGEAVRCRFGVDAVVTGNDVRGMYKGATGGRRDIGGNATGTIEPWPANAFRDGNGWTGWRGPHGNGSADSTNHVFVGHLADAKFVWRTEVTNLPWANWVWEDDRCPGGYSDFAFMSNSLYMAYAVPGERVVNTGFFKGREPGQAELMYRIRRGMGTVSADDCLVAVDGPSGRTLWTSVRKDRGLNHWAKSSVRCGYPLVTPWAEAGRVYAYGTAGRIYCRDGSTGELIWESDVGEATAMVEANLQVFSIPGLARAYAASSPGGKAGALPIPGSLACTAIIQGDGVVACNDFSNTAGEMPASNAMRGNQPLPGYGMAGFDAATGRPVWRFDNCQVGHADLPLRWVHGGKTYFIGVGPQRMVCVEAKTGLRVWEFTSEYILLRGGTPALSGDYLVVQGEHSHGHARITTRAPGQPNPFKGGGMTCYRLSPNGPEFVWAVPASEELFGPDASILVYNGVVYSDNKGRDLLTGKPVMNHTFAMGYAPIGTDGYVVSGRLGIYPVDPSRRTEKAKESSNPLLRKLSGGTDWSAPRQSEYISPVVVDGRFFVRGWHELYCFDLRKERPATATAPMAVENGTPPSTAGAFLDDLSSRFDTRRRDAVQSLLSADAAQRPAIVEQLAAIVEAGSWPAMPAACDALAKMGKDASPAAGRIAAAILRRIGESRWGSALACVDALAAVDRATLASSARQVAAMLKGEPMRVRVACAALAQMREAGAAASPALAELAGSDNEWLAEGAARALAEIGRAAGDAVPALTKELERNRPRVAVQCARALACIGGPQADSAAPVLAKALAAGVQPLSAHAAIALATLSPSAAAQTVPGAQAALAREPRGTVSPLKVACEAILSGQVAPR